MITGDLIRKKIIDTALTTELSETCYCDTTVHLNDTVFYSIISVNDKAGVCTYFFVASINPKTKNVIASKFLHSDCDVDYSNDTYDLYDHEIVSQEKIKVTKTTIFQKKKRTSPNEEENIDHKHTQNSLLSISQTGKINKK